MKSWIKVIGFLMIVSGTVHAQEWVNTWGPEGGAMLELVESSGKIYGRTATNLYVSEDDGLSWTLLGGEEFENGTPGYLTATSFGIHFSYANTKVSSIYDGTTIEASAEGFGQFEFPSRISSVKDTLLAVAGANLYKSIDGATTWTVAGTVGFGDLVYGAGDLIITSSVSGGIKASTDGGATFESFGPTVSFELLNSVVTQGDKFVFATNTGVWAKNAAGEWEKTFTNTGSFLNLALIEDSIYGLNGSVSVIDGKVVGSADIYASADTGKTWTKVEIESEVKPLYGDHNKVVEVGGKLYATAIQKSNPMVSNDGGITWEWIGTTGIKNPRIRGIFPIESSIFVTTSDGAGIGQFGEGVFRSDDKGTSWSKLNIDLPDGHNNSFYTIRSNGADLYASSYAGLFKSSDNGETWTIVQGTESWYISDIHFTDNLWIMAGGDGFSRVWTSGDAGATWTAQYQGIGAVFETFHEAENAIVIGSNTALIASSQDQGATWHFATADSGLGLIGGGYYDVGSIDSVIYSLPINEEAIYRSDNGGIKWEKATDLVGLAGVSFDKLFNKDGDLYIYGTKLAFVDGAIVYPKFLYKSTDGINFEEVMEIVGVPNGYGSAELAFASDELLLGYKGTPIFRYTSDNMGTFVEADEMGRDKFTLSQNYPNPFNPSTNISFNLSVSGRVTLKVYNLLGQEVADVVNQNMTSGTHTIFFDASGLASGVYIYRLQAGNSVQTKKMLLIK